MSDVVIVGTSSPLEMHVRRCECGRTAGAYDRDLWGAWISGANAVPLGFGDASFGLAMKNRPQRSPGREFIAFVIERDCPTVRHVDGSPALSPDQLWEKGRGMNRLERVLNQLRLAWELNSQMQFTEFLGARAQPEGGPQSSLADDRRRTGRAPACCQASPGAPGDSTT